MSKLGYLSCWSTPTRPQLLTSIFTYSHHVFLDLPCFLVQVSRFRCTPLNINSPVNLQQPVVLQSDSPSHCIMTPQSFCNNWFALQSDPRFEMTPNKQLYTSCVENNFWYCLIVFLSLRTKSMSAWHFVFEIQTKQYHWVPFEIRYHLPTMMQDNSISCLI